MFENRAFSYDAMLRPPGTPRPLLKICLFFFPVAGMSRCRAWSSEPQFQMIRQKEFLTRRLGPFFCLLYRSTYRDERQGWEV